MRMTKEMIITELAYALKKAARRGVFPPTKQEIIDSFESGLEAKISEVSNA